MNMIPSQAQRLLAQTFLKGVAIAQSAFRPQQLRFWQRCVLGCIVFGLSLLLQRPGPPAVSFQTIGFSQLWNAPALAQSAIPPENESSTQIAAAPVVLRGQALFSIQTGVGAFSAQDRADAINKRLLTLAEDDAIALEAISISTQGETMNVGVGDRILVTLTPTDAMLADQPQALLVRNYRDLIRQAIAQYRIERTPAYRRQARRRSAWATGLLLLAWLALRFCYPPLINSIRRWRQRYIPAIRIRNVEVLGPEQLTQLLAQLAQGLQRLLYLITFGFYIVLLLSYFPATKAIGRLALDEIKTSLLGLGQGFVSYFPDLFTLLTIGLVTYYVLKFLKRFFVAVRRKKITIEGFYPDWAQPTSRLLAALIIALAGVVAFPYFPGFGSPAFQGISLFLGVLFSLGSTSVVTNVVAGVVLIYTRAFQPGDRVKIGDSIGDIVDKTLLVTRMRTIKNVVITIPNSTITNSEIVNYSAAQNDPNEPPLILNTTITLGYDVPWPKVHATLIRAAEATGPVLSEPKPFVLQTSLDDFYVSYELNVYTEKPAIMAKIYSELHQNIQDQCNAADIEILSPHYRAVRDGNLITIPEQYLDENYQIPAFRVEAIPTKKPSQPPASSLDTSAHAHQ